jgi:hypothetical protein
MNSLANTFQEKKGAAHYFHFYILIIEQTFTLSIMKTPGVKAM